MSPPAFVKATLEEISSFKRYHIVDTFCGIYFLFDGDTCVYVGKSNNIHARVQQHKTRGLKDFDSYTWMPCEPHELDCWELHYIQLINPKFNRAGIVLREYNPVDDRMSNLLKEYEKRPKSVHSIMGAIES